MPMPGPLVLPSQRSEFSEIDRKTKTEAIKQARSGLVGIQALIEQCINDNPPRFDPKEAHDVRNRFEFLSQKLEDVMNLLAQERDEFEQLNFHAQKLGHDVVAANKSAKEFQEKSTHWYTEAMRLRRIMEKEGLKYD